MWLCLRFCCGAVSLGYNNVLSVYITELTSGVWRSRVGHFFGESCWNAGIVALGILAYFVRDMIAMELIIGLTGIPFLLVNNETSL